MIRITFNTQTKVATIGATNIKTAADVPVEVVFTSAPGDVGPMKFAIGSDSDTPTVLAQTDVFAQENATTWRATLDTRDTRLSTFMSGKATAGIRAELAVLLDGERIVTPNMPLSVQKYLITPPSLSGAFAYLTPDGSSIFQPDGTSTYLQPIV